MKFIQRILCLFLVLFLLVSALEVSGPYLYANDSQTISYQYTQVNPLYQDTVSKSDLKTSKPLLYSSSYENEEYYSVSEAADVIRPYLKQRIEEFTVNAYLRNFNNNEQLKTLMTDIIDAAMEHTGVPTEGDYLLWQYAGWSASCNGGESNGTAYVTISYTLTYYTTAAQERKVDAVVDDLLNEWDADDFEDAYKLSAIYDYLCENITYDYKNLNDDNYKLKHTAYAGLVNGTCVCQGYALILYRFALELGVDCRLIAGDGGGPHGWNIAEVDGFYYNLDSTWDAGMDVYNYFLVSPDHFTDHIRYDEYDTRAFHQEYPMSKSDYHDYTDPVFDWSDSMDSCTASSFCPLCKNSFEETCKVTASGGPISCIEDTTIVYTATCTLHGTTYTDTREIFYEGTGHKPVVLKAVPASCTEDGYTEGSQCSVCHEILIPQERIPAYGHDYKDGVCQNCGACVEAPVITAQNTASSGRIRISWDPVADAVRYYIYRSNSKTGDYRLITIFNRTNSRNERFSDTTAAPGESYYYYIIAENAEGMQSRPSNTVKRTCDCAYPVFQSISNIRKTGLITMTWKPVNGAVKYQIWRSTSKDGNYTLMKTTTDTSYTNLNAKPGKLYYYKIKAIASNSTANSAFSVVNKRTCDLPVPTQVKVKLNDSGHPKLTWKAVDGAAKYQIYRSTSKNGKYTLMKTVTGTSYVNNSARSGVTYYYKVRALHTNTNAHSQYSDIRTIQAE